MRLQYLNDGKTFIRTYEQMATSIYYHHNRMEDLIVRVTTGIGSDLRWLAID